MYIIIWSSHRSKDILKRLILLKLGLKVACSYTQIVQWNFRNVQSKRKKYAVNYFCLKQSHRLSYSCYRQSTMNWLSLADRRRHFHCILQHPYCTCSEYVAYLVLLGRVAAAYSRQTFPWTICRSVRTCVGRSVCPVQYGKTANRIRIQFIIIDRTGAGMRQVMGFGDRSTGRGTLGGEFVARHC